MFKKLKKWFLLGLLTITSGALIGTGISLANEDMTQTVAATMSGGEVLYLQPNSNWKEAGARFAAYFFINDETNTWESMIECDNNSGIYKVTVPSGSWVKLIFCRMNPSSSDNSWGNKWNQTGDLEYDGTNNLYTINDGSWGDGTWSVFTEKDVLAGGQPIYLDLVFYDWSINNARFGIYFFNKNGGKDAFSNRLTKVENSDGIVYEGVVPKGTWSRVIAIRLNNTATSVSFDFKWNQTNNIEVIENMNVINITGWEKGEAATTFTEEARAYCFSKYLISQTDSACKNYENNIPSDIPSDYSQIWENLEAQYNNMHTSAKDYLKTAVADKNETEDHVKIAMARYDHIVAKYGLKNFLERETTSSSRLFANSINSNNSTLIIILASITAIGLISVLFITFKRKRA